MTGRPVRDQREPGGAGGAPGQRRGMAGAVARGG